MTLKDWLKLKNITSAEFCRRSGINSNTLSRYINSERTPKKEFMQKIHEITNGEVSYSDWYVESEKNSKPLVLSISQDNIKLRENIMQFFKLDDSSRILEITNNLNSPVIEIGNYVAIKTNYKKLIPGYFLIGIDDEEEIFKVVRDGKKIFLINNFSKVEYNNNYIIKGKVVGRIVVETL